MKVFDRNFEFLDRFFYQTKTSIENDPIALRVQNEIIKAFNFGPNDKRTQLDDLRICSWRAFETFLTRMKIITDLELEETGVLEN